MNFYIYDFETSSIERINLINEDEEHLWKEYLEKRDEEDKKNKPRQGLFPNFMGNAYCQVGSKLLFIGGKDLASKKLMNSIFSFDMALYTTQEEMIRENNILGRYCHGALNIYGQIFILGGFEEVVYKDDELIFKCYENKKENFSSLNKFSIHNTLNNNGIGLKSADTIKVIKYDSVMYKWNDYEIQGGSKPKDMVFPELSFFQDQYLLSFSSFKYNKIFILDLKSTFGFTQELKEDIPKMIYSNLYESLLKSQINLNNEEEFINNDDSIKICKQISSNEFFQYFNSFSYMSINLDEEKINKLEDKEKFQNIHINFKTAYLFGNFNDNYLDNNEEKENKFYLVKKSIKNQLSNKIIITNNRIFFS
jgi:hypothetical protein